MMMWTHSAVWKRVEPAEEERGQGEVQEKAQDSAYMARTYTANSELLAWHCRLGHRNMQDVAALLGLPRPTRNVFCEACVRCKSTRFPLTARSGGPQNEAPATPCFTRT